MKRILGLDLGTNSIGWALIEQDFKKKQGKILGIGSRIIPMSQDLIGDFGKGNTISQTAERTSYRGVRRLRERHLLRRERLHRVLNVLGFLPKHYALQIDFEKRLGQFRENLEPKLAWNKNEKGNFEFIFQESFDEMVEAFVANGHDSKIPYDWTIYYLRKKAITQKIKKEELAWIILNFNQKRGYYQLRGEEEEENPNKLVEFHSLKIVDIQSDEELNKKGETWYSLVLENGWVYRRSSKTDLSDWKGKVKDFIVTTDVNDDGSIKTNKEGEPKRSFRAPKEDDWTLLKKKTEQEIINSDKTVGAYIYEALLQNPSQKIRGKLVRTIERKFYKKELKAILKKQIELQPELFTTDLYNGCIRELYRSNEGHRLQLKSKNDFVHLFLNDIIFYQRPLKSQKTSIGNCSLEYKTYKIKDGLEQTQFLKGIPKSNPYYQEFRVWQWMYNLKIYSKKDDADLTSKFIKSTEDQEKLFGFLMSKKEVNHIDILNYFLEPLVNAKFPNAKPKALKTELAKEIAKYRWNYVFDDSKDKEDEKSKKYPMNETGYEIGRRLEKVENVPVDFFTRKIEQQLWHIIYSVTDKNEFEKALKTFADRNSIDINSFKESFKNHKPYVSEYGRYSEKAIKKLLPLMRTGKYWEWDNIDSKIKSRIDKLISGEFDEEIQNRVREKAINLTEHVHFQGLQLWLAQYIVYDRHSEASDAGKWSSVADLDDYLREFKQHSLRNPIVEQVVTETLRVVKDIWNQFGKGEKDFFDEIHIELGRDLKNPSDKRKRISNTIAENENTNLRIKSILSELLNDKSVENVRPYSPMQQEALKIYEEGVLNSGIDVPDEIERISHKAEPSKSEIQRYKLWLEQKYKSPYTGRPIPLNKLFTSAYEIEHVIPQSRYFDDSISNKVICESEVNSLKDRQLGLEFIKNHHGQKVSTVFGVVEILNEEVYTEFVNNHFHKNRSKRSKLLLEDIPDKMIERQLNDTRYISKFVTNLLSNIVRSDKNDDGVNSNNIISINGKITSKLKQDWGINGVWNDLILPRFQRMNELTESNDFTSWNDKYQKYLPTVPLELSKGFQKKRIDHRHHAMDALVIACATRSHVNYLNNTSAKVEDLKSEARKKKQIELRTQLKNSLCFKTKPDKDGNYKWIFNKPWSGFTVDVKNELEGIVVSFKQNLRVINKATNYYEKIENGKKVKVEQKGVNWAIRKPMHKETVSGFVELPRIKVPKGKILTATRKNLDTSFNQKVIDSITDTGIQKILKNYLLSKGGKPDLAFSPEGIEDMNRSIHFFNDGKPHKPILKVRIFEVGTKYPVGYEGNKKTKYVEAAKGTNLFFAIYFDNKTKKRIYETIPLNIVIERQKQGLSSVPDKDEKGNRLLFHLSPNDIVYVPTKDEVEDISNIDFRNLSSEKVNRIYKVVSFSKAQSFFIRNDVAISIVNKEEFSSLNKMERSMDDQMIKDCCIKLKVDRLGNISRA